MNKVLRQLKYKWSGNWEDKALEAFLSTAGSIFFGFVTFCSYENGHDLLAHCENAMHFSKYASLALGVMSMIGTCMFALLTVAVWLVKADPDKKTLPSVQS